MISHPYPFNPQNYFWNHQEDLTFMTITPQSGKTCQSGVTLLKPAFNLHYVTSRTWSIGFITPNQTWTITVIISPLLYLQAMCLFQPNPKTITRSDHKTSKHLSKHLPKLMKALEQFRIHHGLDHFSKTSIMPLYWTIPFTFGFVD